MFSKLSLNHGFSWYKVEDHVDNVPSTALGDLRVWAQFDDWSEGLCKAISDTFTKNKMTKIISGLSYVETICNSILLYLNTFLYFVAMASKHKKKKHSVTRRCSVKNLFLKISQNSLENTCVGVSFSWKPATLLKSDFSKGKVFSSEFSKLFWISPVTDFRL